MDSCLRSIVASHQSTHRTAAFDLLHDDIKSAIVSFLDARSVVALQSCSRDWRSRCTQHAIWERLFTLDFGYPYRAQNSLRPVNVGATPSSSPHWVIRPFIALSPRHGSMTRVVPVTPRAESLRGLELVHARWAYMRSVLSHKATRAASAARFQARKQRFQMIVDRIRLRWFLDALDFPLGIGSLGLSIFVTSVLLLSRLGGSAPQLPWAVVFLPQMLYSALWTLEMVVGVVSLRCDLQSEVCRGQAAGGRGWFDCVMGRPGEPREWWTLWGWLPFAFSASVIGLAMFMTPLLVVLKLEGALPEGTPWAAVMAPVWLIFFILVAGLPAFFRIVEPVNSTWAIVSGAFTAIVVVAYTFVAMAVARADGAQITAAAMFTPLWLIEVCFFATAIVVLIYNIRMVCRRGDMRPNVPAFLLWAVFTTIAGLAVGAQVWASIYDLQTGTLPVVGLLAPIACIAGLSALLNFTTSLFCWWDSRRYNHDLWTNVFREEYTRRAFRLACCCCYDNGQVPVIPAIEVLGLAVPEIMAGRLAPPVGAVAPVVAVVPAPPAFRPREGLPGPGLGV